jgi:hypothetical protein
MGGGWWLVVDGWEVVGSVSIRDSVINRPVPYGNETYN